MNADEDIKALGKNIRTVRKNHKLTQEALAFDADISVKMLSEYENGKRDMSSQVLFKIANALMVPVDELLPEYLRVPEEKVHSAPEEEILLNMIRNMNSSDKDMILNMARRLSTVA